MKGVIDWLDRRTGIRRITHIALFENVPGGARWRYVWGSTLTFGLFVQFVTGVFLWMAYSPSSHTAWESVFYIQYEMAGGWLLRGLHHFTAQVMTVLLVLHLMQVVIDGAYKAPREVNFWFGLMLLVLVLALSLTGYALGSERILGDQGNDQPRRHRPRPRPDSAEAHDWRVRLRSSHFDALLCAARRCSAGADHHAAGGPSLPVPAAWHYTQAAAAQARCSVLAGSIS